MKDKLKRKLRSERGVTLLFSLLLFLVCAVAGSVLITAGTASSGTVSERAELDRRYFSVTSAAELLRNKFDGQSVSVDLEIVETDDNKKEWIVTSLSPDLADAKAETKLVIAQSLYLLDTLDKKDKEEHPDKNDPIQWHEYQAIIDAADAKLGEYTLTAKDTDENPIETLTASVTVARVEASRLTFTVTSDDGKFSVTSDDGKFSLQMDYSAGVVKEVGIDAVSYTVNWKIGKVSLPR